MNRKKLNLRLQRKISTIENYAYYLLKSRNNYTLPVFIMGCGRSGTTLMLDIFHSDIRIEALGENNPKVANKIFKLEYSKIHGTINQSKAQIIALKPILNSFDARKLISEYNGSVIFWLIRDYKDMVSSSLIKFGDKVANYMKELVVNNRGDNWLSQGIPISTVTRIRKLNIQQLKSQDWMALIWWSVNHTILIDDLKSFDRFHLIKYESFVQNHEFYLKKMYRIMKMNPKQLSKFRVHSGSIGKGVDIRIDKDIEKMCKELMIKLSHYYL